MPPENIPAAGAAMSMKTIVGIIAAIVVVGGGGYWYLTQKGGMSEESGEKSARSGMPVPNGSGTEGERIVSGSLADIWKQKGNYTCTVATNIPNATSQGTVYIAGERIRGDFTSQTQGKSVQTSMIRKDDTVYTWTSAYPQGFKVKSVDTANPLAGPENGSAGTVNGAQYDCSPWTPDESKFMLPPGVTFMELPGQR